MKFFIIALILWVLGTVSKDWFVAGTLLQVSFSFFMLALFLEIPYSKAAYKYSAYLWCCLCFSNDLCDPIVDHLNTNTKYYYLSCFALSALSVIYLLCRSYKLPSDEYTGEGVYLKFKKPDRIFGLSMSLLFRPTSSVSIIIDNEWYGFKTGKPFRKNPYQHFEDYCLLRIPADNTYKSFLKKKLRLKLNTKWSLFKNNCCIVAQTVINHDFSPLDFIPCVFLKTLEELKKNGNL